MKVEQVPVTGREEKKQLTPQMRALSEFYQALNTRDLELMARNWAQTDEAVMDNPVGGIKRGWEEIRTVYERIFRSAGQYWFEFYGYSYHEAGEIFYIVGRERGEHIRKPLDQMDDEGAGQHSLGADTGRVRLRRMMIEGPIRSHLVRRTRWRHSCGIALSPPASLPFGRVSVGGSVHPMIIDEEVAVEFQRFPPRERR